MQRSTFRDYATAAAVAFIVLGPTPSIATRVHAEDVAVEVRAVRRTWPIVREPSGAWGVAGETVIRNHGESRVNVTAATVALHDAAGRVLREETYDTQAALAGILAVYSGVESGLPARHPAGTLTVAPGEVGVVFVAVLTEALPHHARITMRFDSSPERTLAIPLETFHPGQAFVWPLPLDGLPWAAGNTVGTPAHWWNGAIVTPDRVFISQRFAIDTVRVDALGQTHPEGSSRKEDFYAWGADVSSMGRGQVVAVADAEPDLEMGQAPSETTHPAGNHVVVRYGPTLYGVYAHLQHGSVRVRVGDAIGRGQVLARVGNSGNTSEPHLHIHFADRWSNSGDHVRDMFSSQGLPALFWHAAVWRSGAVFPLRAATPLEGDLVLAR